VWLACGLVAVPAAAQSNSLLRGQRSRPAPTSQPVVSQPVPTSAGIGIRPASRVDDAPPPNEVLVMVSPIGVEPPKPRKICTHDLVTVIVRESRTSLNDAKMESQKNWQIKWELAKWLRLDTHDKLVPQVFPDGTPGIDSDFENKYDGKGKYDRKDELTTRITATVIDVKPNGNLILEARKRIKTGDEVVIATLTGECRSEDVTAQNTVLSTQLANLEVDMPELGAVRDATRRGWLMRAFDFLRPF
jgi:flagellar L-ring protein precursor FlgH